MKIYPSLLAANLLKLDEQIRLLEPHCDGFHIDVMDDHFVPNLAFGPKFVSAIREVARESITVHLMVDKPEKWVERLDLAPCDRFVFHWEATGLVRAKGLIKKIRAKNWNVGLAINPATKVVDIEELVSELDLVVVMGVEPGHSGQKFIDGVAYKISELVSLNKKLENPVSIALDGGVNKSNIAVFFREGVGMFAVGSAIFGASDPVEALSDLYAESDRLPS